jgi:epoxyqueuosine reductase
LCIDNCPTNSIKPGRFIDARTCISYLTIEKRGAFTQEQQESIEYQIFGCDVCQQICPWNHTLTPRSKSPFSCFDRWQKLKIEDLLEMPEDLFNRLKRKSVIKRTGIEGMKRNAAAVLKT